MRRAIPSTGDGDVGANNLQNFPVLTSAIPGSNVTIQGSLNSTASTAFTIQFFYQGVCNGSGSGEGQTLLGTTSVTTNGSGNVAIAITFPVAVATGQYITATATDPAGNTSEFSQCIQVACSYPISPASQFFTLGGGVGSVNVMAQSACSWMAVASDSWIIITSPDSDTGNGTVTLEVGENFTGSARQGTVTLAGLTFTLIQDGGLGEDCDYSISPAFRSFTASGGTGSVNVVAAERCAWQATSNVTWVTITSGNVGIGNGVVSYSVAANLSATGRNGIITLGGKAFAIKQKSS